MPERTGPLTPLGEQLQRHQKGHYTWIGEVTLNTPELAGNIHILTTPNSHHSPDLSRSTPPYPATKGNQERTAINWLTRHGILPGTDDKSKRRPTHQQGDSVYWGQFIYEVDGVQHELLFVPNAEYGRQVKELLELLAAGNLADPRLAELQGKGISFVSVSRETYDRMFTPTP